MPIKFPGTVQVVSHPIPEQMVVPVQGPPGPKGPPGDSSDVLGFTYVGTVPAAVHLIEHGLPYNPGGITCQDADGETVIGWSVTHPAPGFTEITFGVDITPTIYLS